MKKVVILLFLVLGVSSLSHSQELRTLVSGKWFVDSMKIGNEKFEFLNGSNWLELNSDGRYHVMMSNKEENGTWKLITDKNELEFDDKSFDKNLKIEKISETMLLVSAKNEETIYTMWLKK
ncbi:hypothetical protein MHM83_06305 [Tenacibaculum sp. Mcav3-52]|uniref:Lipocalin-like domain-containing protein n=1 Tax=Tenacibaculum sp. Pbs-1 TaxID=3238748 RepID=A0AB33KW60_9FLAO|nr:MULTISPECIES: hypothetical protein [Tenacibaculum]GFD76309.1 hypothetical protein KUL113_57290 [Tenacibaculum sp. KUL113]GFD93793.1 hypothetical protein KUL154_25260 [Alteromonas sp. KUL154]GFE02973.1 hypothetical protein KUL156_55650 [Alteromonas sp. KUL156]KAF9660346.1 hypothetical protein HBA12_08945 [Tenacibaculum mesophilum]MCG7501477.1 hypothetical protein [Tenacibaculum sp. Mcav3-52]